jgi:MFS transporter, OFA family, oxalate/formate antiporter
MWLAFSTGFVSMAQRVGFGILYPSMVADQGWSVGEITGAFSAAMLIYSPAAVLCGVLVDRVGVRATMVLGTAFFAGGLALLGLAQVIWQVYLVYAVAIAFGTAAVGFVPMIKLASLRAFHQVGWFIGLFNAGQGLGALVTSPILQLIVDATGWRAGFAALAVAVLLAIGPLALVGAPGRTERTPVHGRLHMDAASGLWQQPAFWLIMLANAGIGYLLLLPAHHVAHLALVGLPSLVAATAGGLMGACIGLGALLGGWAADRWKTSRLALAGAVLMGLGVLALLGSGPAAIWVVGAYVVAGGLGRGILGVSVAAFQARTFAGPSLGRVTGLLDLGFGIGAFAGPYLTALARDQTGSYAAGLASALAAGLLAATCTELASGARGRSRESVER